MSPVFRAWLRSGSEGTFPLVSALRNNPPSVQEPRPRRAATGGLYPASTWENSHWSRVRSVFCFFCLFFFPSSIHHVPPHWPDAMRFIHRENVPSQSKSRFPAEMSVSLMKRNTELNRIHLFQACIKSIVHTKEKKT